MRLLTYNIHKGIGGRDRRYRLERIVEVIEHENPDLICLQEVARHIRRTRGDDQSTQLVEQLAPAEHIFQLNVHFRTGGYGNMILSKWALSESSSVEDFDSNLPVIGELGLEFEEVSDLLDRRGEVLEMADAFL